MSKTSLELWAWLEYQYITIYFINDISGGSSWVTVKIYRQRFLWFEITWPKEYRYSKIPDVMALDIHPIQLLLFSIQWTQGHLLHHQVHLFIGRFQNTTNDCILHKLYPCRTVTSAVWCKLKFIYSCSTWHGQHSRLDLALSLQSSNLKGFTLFSSTTSRIPSRACTTHMRDRSECLGRVLPFKGPAACLPSMRPS